MSPADSAYAVRPAAEADFAAVLRVLAHNLLLLQRRGTVTGRSLAQEERDVETHDVRG